MAEPDSSLSFAGALAGLRSDTSHDWGRRTKGRAPHKPFLLLSVMDGIECGWITGPHIELSRDLQDTFFTYWNAIMRKDQITTIALPYFYMEKDFWKLIYVEGVEPFKNKPSVGGLRKRVKYAELDPDLFEQFSSPEQRDRYRNLLLTTYFDEETAEELRHLVSLNRLAYDYSEEIIGKAAEPFEKYAAGEEGRYGQYKGKRQVREKGFRRAIRLIYEDTCALCRSRVVTQNDESLIEGAHIIPWQNNGTDDPRNGLALCGTHHWLFDRYLYTVDDDYRIVLSGWLKRKENSAKEVIQREGSEIFLPDEEQFCPSLEAISEHREKFREANS